MFELFPNRGLWLAAVLSCSFIVSGPAQAHDNDEGQHSKTVNCHESDKTVQSVIDKVKAGRDTTIFIVGFCDESVSIVKDGITLSGNKDGSGAIGGGLGEVKVTGAQRIIVEYLELTGDGYGVLAQEGRIRRRSEARSCHAPRRRPRHPEGAVAAPRSSRRDGAHACASCHMDRPL